MMTRPVLLTLLALLTSSPFSLGKSELEILRTRCAEQERQIRDLEEQNSKLRLATGMAAKPSTRLTPVSTPLAATTAPAKTPPATGTSKAAGESTTYTVRSGDSWERVARKFGTQPAKLAALNGTKSSAMLLEGQKLKVPATASASAASVATASKTANPGTYQVKQGDTYFSIGKKFGISPDTLVAANPKIEATALRPGLTIQLGKSNQAASPAAPAAVAKAPAQAAKAPATAAAAPPKPSKTAPLSSSAAQTVSTTSPVPKSPIKSVTINDSPTYGEFATKHGTTVDRLNDLNALDLVESTTLAKGSELLVPAQP